MQIRKLLGTCIFVLAFGIPVGVFAAPATLTYSYEHHIYTVTVSAHPEWQQAKTQWTYRGQPAVPPPELLTCGPDESLPEGWDKSQSTDYDAAAIIATLREVVGKDLERPAGSVTISKNTSGSIVFDGKGLTGRTIDYAKAAELTKQALAQDIAFVVLPVEIQQPQVTVNDASLTQMGIKEVVMVGESQFAGSPKNRQHNIAVGTAKFNGHLIPQGSTFSFDQVLGPVNDKTGYLKELVIQGDKTLPDYGGGLCQVSTTAYRGPWEYGLPILQRKNHSYAVSYYGPQGTDATIYPPNADMKFKNDTPGALLIQTFITDDLHAYFIYYGTKDNRTAEVFGPYISDRKSAPRDALTIEGTDVPPGVTKKVSDRHDGLTAVWYRMIAMPNTPVKTERVHSIYETRQLTYEIGIDPKRSSGAVLSAPGMAEAVTR